MIKENLFEILFFIGIGCLFAGLFLLHGCGVALYVVGGVLILFAFVMIILESLPHKVVE